MDSPTELPVSPEINSNTDGEEEPRYFLLADDDLGDRLLLNKALEENNIRLEHRFVAGGEELVSFLNQKLESTDSKDGVLPCLILLDLYMPRLDGQEVLRLLKADPRFKKIPIVILTSSNAYGDILQSYNNGANSFLTKPLNYKDLVKLMGLVNVYWLQEVRLPH